MATTRESMESGAVLVGVGVAAWLAYQAYQTFKGPAGAVGNAYQAATTAIANLFPGTSPTVIPQGSVSLPNGSIVPVSTLTSNGFQPDGTLSMSDASGNAYTVQPGDTPGSYVASVPISGLGRLRGRRSGGLR